MVRPTLSLLFFAAAAHAVPEGFTIREFVGTAQEPEIYPTAVAAAANGDVYISSDKNGSLGHIKGMGRILLARDTKGAGKADVMIEYAKVESPRGGHWVGGVFYLVNPPFLTAFRDKDGDGKADEQVLLVDGLGGGIEHPRGADHTTNGCRMGIDGWLYIAVGDFGAGNEKEKAGAKGRDGKRVTLYGGGVMRVRPDGSELETYTEMTRNICDTAISPTLDLFSRDNTNDGKGWNTRFHHFTALANAGYPRLYKNFDDETARPLADYGGGSGTGGLYLSEPGFPKGWGETLFTCDWTTGTIHNHPIKQFEATFVAQQQTFHKVKNATDIDVDGSSRLYIADWRAGGFSYLGKGKQQGMIQQVVATGVTPHKYVDVNKVGDAELVQLLASDSAVQRLEASRRLIDLKKVAQAPAVLALASAGKAHLYHRVAAIFTYKQMLGKDSTPGLVGLTKDDVVREFALRALADRTSELAGVPVQPFVDGLKDANARVRLQALIGLQRLGAKEAVAAIVDAASTWPVDESKVEEGAHYRLPHTAIAALGHLGHAKPLLEAAKDPAKRYIAFRSLQLIHTNDSVDGLIALSLTGDADLRAGAIGALARLYHVEKPWNYKDWWSTRPDDRGPYFIPAEWEATPRIKTAIEAAYAKLPGNLRMAVLEVLAKNRIAVTSLKLEGLDPIRLAMASQTLRPADIALLIDAALSSKRPWNERFDCYKALSKLEGNEAIAPRVQVLAGWLKEKGAPAGVEQAINDFVNDGQRGNEVKQLRALANKAEDANSRILWRSLLTVLSSPLTKEAQKKAVQAEIDKNPRDIGFFLAVSDLGLSGFDKAIDAAIGGDNTILINAAKAAREAGKAAAVHKGKRLAELSLADATAAGLKGKGNLKLGQKLYTQQGCVACHSVEPTAEQKGPYLGSAGAKFSREYLVESVLQPHKVVAQGFQTVIYQMKDDSQQMGFVTGEADGVITLRNVAGQVTKLKRADIRNERHDTKSMMPEGLAAGLTAEEFSAMIDYLASLKAIGG
ncbi:MAG: hypothetical protein RLZ70_354 [Verrucomicrobiota bacterium]|jgi:putative heme-binding domain-containing protein